MSAGDSSVSAWVEQLQEGDGAAAQKLWERYFQQLVGLARSKLGGLPRRAADEEDVALSAFNSFFQGVAQGRFPQLADRDNLWCLLVTITARKAFQFRLHHKRLKRDSKLLRDEAAMAGDNSKEMGLEQFIGREPTPEFAAQAVEEYQRLLAQLPDASWTALVQWKLEGYSNIEIAAKLGCGLRSVERRLRLIRGFWNRSLAEADGTP